MFVCLISGTKQYDQRQKIPPIVVPNCFDWYIFLCSLQVALPLVPLRLTQGSSIHLFPHSVEDFRTFQKALMEQKHTFNTLMLLEDRKLKVGITEIPHSTSPDPINKELESESLTPTPSIPLCTKKPPTSENLPGQIEEGWLIC